MRQATCGYEYEPRGAHPVLRRHSEDLLVRHLRMELLEPLDLVAQQARNYLSSKINSDALRLLKFSGFVDGTYTGAPGITFIT